MVVPLDLEDGVGVHTEAVVLFPDLQHRLAPHLVLGECSVAADLAGPGVDQLVVVRVAGGLGLQVDSVKQLQLEEIEIPEYNIITSRYRTVYILPFPDLIRYLVDEDIVHPTGHQPVVVVIVLHLGHELVHLGLLGQVGQLGVQVRQYRGSDESPLLELVQL